MILSPDLWFGALLSIPIGIGTGLAVTPLQRALENRGKAKAVAETKRAKEIYTETLFFVGHPHLFTQYLIQVAIKTTFIGSAVGIFSGLFYLVGQMGALSVRELFSWAIDREALNILGFGLGQVVAIFSSVMIVSICMPAMKLWHRVRNFEEYVKGLPTKIRDIATENKIMAAIKAAGMVGDQIEQNMR
jgi:hypothetical protein